MGRSRQSQDSYDLLLLAATGIVICLLYLVLSGCASIPTNGEKYDDSAAIENAEESLISTKPTVPAFPYKPDVPTLASTETAIEDPWSKERQEAADFYRGLQAKRNRRSRLFLTITRTFDTVISIYGLTQTDLVEAGWFHSLTDAPVVSILVVDTAVFLARRWLGKKYPGGRFQVFDYTSGSISGAAAVKNLWKIMDQRASPVERRAGMAAPADFLAGGSNAGRIATQKASLDSAPEDVPGDLLVPLE